MSQSAKALSDQAMQLPPVERMALVEHILDSLDEPDPSMDALWAREADDRLVAYRRGEIRAVPLSEVLARLQNVQRRMNTPLLEAAQRDIGRGNRVARQSRTRFGRSTSG